jgi:hypothetical protein
MSRDILKNFQKDFSPLAVRSGNVPQNIINIHTAITITLKPDIRSPLMECLRDSKISDFPSSSAVPLP